MLSGAAASVRWLIFVLASLKSFASGYQHESAAMTSDAAAESAIERRLRLVRQHGYNGLTLLTLYDGWRYFEPPNIEGFVPYELHRSVVVACGDPVCAEGDLGALLAGFVEYCQLRGWRFAMVGATPRVAQAAAKLHLKPLKIGEEALFDLSGPMPRGKAAKSLGDQQGAPERRGGRRVQETIERGRR